MKIAVVVPTCREEKYKDFMQAWMPLFIKHDVMLCTVMDGDNPLSFNSKKTGDFKSVSEVMGKYSDLIINHNDGVRNLGFAVAYEEGADIIISLDDDVEPIGDPIEDHIRALEARYPVSWMNTVDEVYMRGFPYNIREEAECVLSHGVWKGVADFDALTQIKIGTPEVTPRKMPIPKGILFPMCIMNVSFKRKMMPYMYQAPMFDPINRFADIWAGIEAKKAIDEKGWCAVTGYSTVLHTRASDPFINLGKEAMGVSMNEKYGEGDYFEKYKQMRTRWQEFLQQYD
jgi:reversibly glycosylated polypeptide/UDP-arabinopyranose mutase